MKPYRVLVTLLSSFKQAMGGSSSYSYSPLVTVQLTCLDTLSPSLYLHVSWLSSHGNFFPLFLSLDFLFFPSHLIFYLSPTLLPPPISRTGFCFGPYFHLLFQQSLKLETKESNNFLKTLVLQQWEGKDDEEVLVFLYVKK